MPKKNTNTLQTLFKRWTRKMTVNPGANEQALSELQAAVQVELPADYLAFLRWTNGADGDIGKNYVQVWPAEEITSDPYPFEEFVPGLLFIASDGGSGLFGFDTRMHPMPIVIIHRDDLDLDYLVVAAPSFTAFLEFLTTQSWSDYWYKERASSER